MTTLNQIPTYIPVLTKTTKEVYDCYLAEYQIRRLRRTNRWVSLNECVREMRNFRTLIASLVGTLSALKRCTDHWDISTLTPRVDRYCSITVSAKDSRETILSYCLSFNSGGMVAVWICRRLLLQGSGTHILPLGNIQGSYGVTEVPIIFTILCNPMIWNLHLSSVHRDVWVLFLDVRGICRICANNHKQQPELRTHVWLPLDIHIIHPLPRWSSSSLLHLSLFVCLHESKSGPELWNGGAANDDNQYA